MCLVAIRPAISLQGFNTFIARIVEQWKEGS